MVEYFTQSHEWLRKQQDNTIKLGLTKYAQEELGDVVFVDLPEVGKDIKAGDPIVIVESVKAASDINTPISGTVIAVNKEVVENPQLLNESPAQDGWLLIIEASDISELDALLSKEDYDALIKNVSGDGE